jgi:hypothetical protein
MKKNCSGNAQLLYHLAVTAKTHFVITPSSPESQFSGEKGMAIDY